VSLPVESRKWEPSDLRTPHVRRDGRRRMRLARTDALNEYIRHETSGVYAVPPGVRLGSYMVESLLSA
jgi:hypothetical protein